MAEQQWPDEVREAAFRAVMHSMTETGVAPGRAYCEATADDVLAALAPHVVPRQAVLALAHAWTAEDVAHGRGWSVRDGTSCAAELRALVDHTATASSRASGEPA